MTKVLVVDDNVDAAELLVELLSAHALEATPAYSGWDALRCAQWFVPDVVLLDLGLPDLDGFMVAGLLRQVAGCHAARIMALTAWGDSETRRCVLAAGMERHLVKPATFESILQAIDG